MPHAILEYSANIPPIDTAAFLERLHDALAAVGYGLDDIKSRCYRSESFRVGTGQPERAFAHLTLVVLDRREVAVQHAAGEKALALLQETFAGATGRLDCDLTVDVQQTRTVTYFKSRRARPPA